MNRSEDRIKEMIRETTRVIELTQTEETSKEETGHIESKALNDIAQSLGETVKDKKEAEDTDQEMSDIDIGRALFQGARNTLRMSQCMVYMRKEIEELRATVEATKAGQDMASMLANELINTRDTINKSDKEIARLGDALVMHQGMEAEIGIQLVNALGAPEAMILEGYLSDKSIQGACDLIAQVLGQDRVDDANRIRHVQYVPTDRLMRVTMYDGSFCEAAICDDMPTAVRTHARATVQRKQFS